MGRLVPTVKHTGQDSAGKLCGIFKFWWFLPSKPVNNVGKMLQLLGDFVSQRALQIPYRTLLGERFPDRLVCGSQLNENLGSATNNNMANHVGECLGIRQIPVSASNNQSIKIYFSSNKKQLQYNKCYSTWKATREALRSLKLVAWTKKTTQTKKQHKY